MLDPRYKHEYLDRLTEKCVKHLEARDRRYVLQIHLAISASTCKSTCELISLAKIETTSNLSFC